MSHNNNKLGTAEPNRQSELAAGLNDLSDVSAASPSNGEVLQYASGSSSWSAVPVPTGQAVGYIWIGGKTKGYSDSPASSISASDTLYMWDDSPINTISSSSISVTSGDADADKNNWVQSVTLPSGKYVFRCQSMVEFSASGYLAYSVKTSGGTEVTGVGVVGENRGSTYGPSGSIATGYYEISSNTTFNLEVKAVSNVDTIANQGNTPSEYGLIYIEKLAD